jgi:hypothetical protein
LYYLRARYYDPSIGRFMSEDPAQDGLNWYVYCGNNPVMFVDPMGLYTAILNSGPWGLFVLGNVDSYSSGVYCDLRDMVDVSSYPGIQWYSYGNTGTAHVTFNNKDAYYKISIYFDSLEAGTFASDISVYKNNIKVDSNDPVKHMLDTQQAYFFLKEDDYGGGIKVQAKMSTMFWLFENNFMYQQFEMIYQLAVDINREFGYDIQDVLDAIGDDEAFWMDFSGKMPSYDDIFAEVLTKLW